MPDRIPVRRLACPSCGAPIQFDGPTARCDYCGSVLERPRQAAEQPTVIAAPQPAATAAPTYSPRWRVGCFVMAAIFLLATVVPVAVFVLVPGVDETAELPWFTASSETNPSAGRSEFRLQGSAAVLTPVGDGRAPDLLVSAYDFARRATVLLWLEGNPPALRWASEPIDVNASSGVALGSTAVYVAHKQALTALRRADGGRLWQAALTDELSGTLCTACVHEIAGVVAVLSNDGMLQAFDRADGRLLWMQQLRGQPRQLVPLDGNIGVLDKGEDGDADLLLWSAATGELVVRASPRCPNRPFPDDTQGPSIYAPLTLAPGGEALYLAAGFFEPGCLLRLDIAGQEQWQTTFPVANLRARTEPTLVEDAIYLSDGRTVSAVRSADGALTQLFTEGSEDYALTPLGGQGNVLLVAAERQRGTRRTELWAYDRQSGARLWQYTPQAEQIIDGRSVSLFSSSSGRWAWRALPSGVLIVQARPEPTRLVLEVLRWQDGVSSGQTTLPLADETAGSFSLSLLGWDGARSWWLVDDRLWIVDGLTATAEAVWPPR